MRAGAYCDVRQLTEQLAAPLSPEDQTVQSMPDSSPTKWHRAHTTWFFDTFVLEPSGRGAAADPAYGYLFNSYYEAVGPRHPRPQRGLITRPSTSEVAAYRRAVDERMLELLAEPSDPPVDGLVELGLQHEQQHQELLLMDAKHLLAQSPLRPAYRSAPDAGGPGSPAPPVGWVEHEGGVVAIGHDGEGFAFDNEAPRHDVALTPFRLADRLVTAGEWQAFIDDGGYRRPELWMSDGWATVQGEGWEAPLYWERDGTGGWAVFTLHGLRPVLEAEPVVHVSWFEADAFARWAGGRLPTEAEWEAVAARQTAASAPEAGLLDLDVLHPRPAAGPVPGVAGQLIGEVWEWTASQYRPYPRFQPAAGAVGEYNGKFMVNQFVLRGGCCATPPGHARLTYRNFFPPAARWAFSGVRVAADG